MPQFVRAGFTAAAGGHCKTRQCSEARYTGYGDYDDRGHEELKMGI